MISTIAWTYAILHVGIGLGIIFWVYVVEGVKVGNWWKFPLMIFAWPGVIHVLWKQYKRLKP